MKEINIHQKEEPYQPLEKNNPLKNTTQALILKFEQHPKYMKNTNSMKEENQEKEIEWIPTESEIIQ